ncbi:MAG: CaiB/BaiF CoA-transferase family protein [Dehalococcoidia bacterium]|nr:CaiB/BaiF CoA-transferase family protein [Dehalococcoidia bacterium]
MQPLEGVRVLDATKLLPGGYCTLLLADLGAEVIRVEDPAELDNSRWGPDLVRQDRAYYQTLHRNKKSIVLDLKKPQGRELLLRLAGTADIFLESYRPGVMDRLGIAYADLQAVNPRIIYCSISGYGQEGPYRDRVGHDINYLALGGVLATTGESGGPPVIPGVQVADIGAAAMFAAVAVLAALHGREQTGLGRYIDLAMLDGVVSFLQVAAAEYLGLGRSQRRGQMWLSGKWACYTVYRTRNGGYLSLGALEPKFWSRFCIALGLEDLVQHQYVEERQDELRSRVQAVLLERTRQEWVDFLSGLDICCEPVLEVEEALEHPQVRCRGLVHEVVTASGETLKLLGTPFSATSGRTAPPPEVGQHTREVLLALGLTEEELNGLASERVIYLKEG